MGKLFRSMGIIAGLGSIPVAAYALQVVEWGPPAPSPGGPSAGREAVLEIALQHGSGTPDWDILGAPWGESPQPLATPAALSSALGLPEPKLAPSVERDRGSPLFAGLGAVALLMWRRLRRH